VAAAATHAFTHIAFAGSHACPAGHVATTWLWQSRTECVSWEQVSGQGPPELVVVVVVELVEVLEVDVVEAPPVPVLDVELELDVVPVLDVAVVRLVDVDPPAAPVPPVPVVDAPPFWPVVVPVPVPATLTPPLHARTITTTSPSAAKYDERGCMRRLRCEWTTVPHEWKIAARPSSGQEARL
jgi:hypothetical protein